METWEKIRNKIFSSPFWVIVLLILYCLITAYIQHTFFPVCRFENGCNEDVSYEDYTILG